MARPTVLVVDSQESRRRDLVRGLAADGYEVVAAADAGEGERFAHGLKPEVIVAEAVLVDGADPLGAWAAARHQGLRAPIAVLLFDTQAKFDFAAGILAAEVGGAAPDVVLHKVRAVLLGRELALANDPLLESALGDLSTKPLFDLLPELQKARVTGRVFAAGGELYLDEGEVIAARAEAQRGLKAFCRLARTAVGQFRIVPGESPVARELSDDLLSLMALAMEDLPLFEDGRSRVPGLSSRIRLAGVKGTPTVGLPPSQQRLLEEVRGGETLWDLLDSGTGPDGAVLADAIALLDGGVLELDAPEVRARIVTDSAADLPNELARRHQIHVVPLTVTFGTLVHRDGVDVTPEAFYAKLSRGGGHPMTAPPGVAEFLAAYRTVAERHDVVSLHVSERLSHTVVNARAAVREGREELCKLRGAPDPAVEVVDSMQVSTGLGVLALMAARMAHRGLPAPEIRTRLGSMRLRVHLLFVADTPEYLARGGRVGRAQAWLGARLGFKPILALEEGEVVPVDRVRRGDAAHTRLIELLKQRLGVGRPVIAAIGHAAAPVAAVRMRSLLQDSFQVLETIECEIGPVVGSHVGPGCVGAALLQPTEEEEALLAPLDGVRDPVVR